MQESLGCPVDGHVHFHRPGLVAATLTAAARNMAAAGGRSEDLLGVLLLAESVNEDVFEMIAGVGSQEDWRIDPVPTEPESLVAERDGNRLAVVCGRQVRAAGGLEVLALGTRERFAEGASLNETISAVREVGALAIVPWGFGKWLGKRATEIRSALATFGPEELLVGDNGGRLAVLGRPTILTEALASGFKVLPGTDPFPIGSDFRRVGSFGFFADHGLSTAAPMRALRSWIENPGVRPKPYGAALGPLRFARNQLGIRMPR